MVEDLCDDLREHAASTRNANTSRAPRPSKTNSNCPRPAQGIADFGRRDTFPFEERTFLARAVKALVADDIDGAKPILSRHRGSVWIGKGESQAQWGLVEAGLRLVEGCDDADRQLTENARSLDALVGHYAASLRDIDRLQREFEQAVGDYIPFDGALTDAVDHCRKRYAKLAEKVQSLFTKSLETAGWPCRAACRTPTCSTRLWTRCSARAGAEWPSSWSMRSATNSASPCTGSSPRRSRRKSGRPARNCRPSRPSAWRPCSPGAAPGCGSSKDGDGFGVTLDGAQDRVGHQPHGGPAGPLWRPVRGGARWTPSSGPRTSCRTAVELLVLRTTDIDSHLENTPSGTLATLNLIHQSLRRSVWRSTS